jgi:hypothetical protein
MGQRLNQEVGRIQVVLAGNADHYSHTSSTNVATQRARLANSRRMPSLSNAIRRFCADIANKSRA